jgi:hypothetical protein
VFYGQSLAITINHFVFSLTSLPHKLVTTRRISAECLVSLSFP